MWSCSGQKKYYRFKRLIIEISSHNPTINDIFIPNENNRDEAVKKIEKKWSTDGRMKPLSVIEKNL